MLNFLEFRFVWENAEDLKMSRIVTLPSAGHCLNLNLWWFATVSSPPLQKVTKPKMRLRKLGSNRSFGTVHQSGIGTIEYVL